MWMDGYTWQLSAENHRKAVAMMNNDMETRDLRPKVYYNSDPIEIPTVTLENAVVGDY